MNLPCAKCHLQIQGPIYWRGAWPFCGPCVTAPRPASQQPLTEARAREIFREEIASALERLDGKFKRDLMG